MPLKPLILAACLALSPASARATDLVLSFGPSDFVLEHAEDDNVVGLEAHLPAFAEWGGISFSVAGAADMHETGTYWVGAGISAVRPLGEAWFLEASLMPGYFRASRKAQDLGSGLEFRSLVGIGRRLSDRVSLSLAVSHKSNAGTSTRNPGVNLIRLRLRYTLD